MMTMTMGLLNVMPIYELLAVGAVVFISISILLISFRQKKHADKTDTSINKVNTRIDIIKTNFTYEIKDIRSQVEDNSSILSKDRRYNTFTQRVSRDMQDFWRGKKTELSPIIYTFEVQDYLELKKELIIRCFKQIMVESIEPNISDFDFLTEKFDKFKKTNAIRLLGEDFVKLSEKDNEKQLLLTIKKLTSLIRRKYEQKEKYDKLGVIIMDYFQTTMLYTVNSYMAYKVTIKADTASNTAKIKEFVDKKEFSKAATLLHHIKHLNKQAVNVIIKTAIDYEDDKLNHNHPDDYYGQIPANLKRDILRLIQ